MIFLEQVPNMETRRPNERQKEWLKLHKWVGFTHSDKIDYKL